MRNQWPRYFLRVEETAWYEVTVEKYVRAERSAGFLPKGTYSDTTIATAGFTSGMLQGSVAYSQKSIPAYYTPLMNEEIE